MEDKLEQLRADLDRAVHRAKFYGEPVTLAMAEDHLAQVKELVDDLDEIHNDCFTEDDRTELERERDSAREEVEELEKKLAALEADQPSPMAEFTVPPGLAGKVVRLVPRREL